MKYFKKELGNKGAYAKYYIQERSNEIDSERKFPTIVICPGGAFIMTSFREDEAIALRFLDAGFNVVIVHYATDGSEKYLGKSSDAFPTTPVSLFPNSLVELATAVSYVRENSKKFAVNEKYIIKETRKKEHNFKDYICPDTMEFEKDYFKMGNRYGRVLFLREYASYIKDRMVAELTGMNRNLMMSIDIAPVLTDEC